MMSRLNQIKSEIQKITKNDPAHDFSHVVRVYKNAEFLCKKEKIKSDLILPAVLLHDIVSFKKSDPRNKTASAKSALKAKTILKKCGYDESEITLISDAIHDHSFSKNVVPGTVEGKILQDADRLDALGAIGIARVFAVGGSDMRSLYNIDDPFCKTHVLDDGKWTVDHFYRKLLKLEKSMNTVSGKSLARERTLFLKNFLRQLSKEV